MQPPPPWYKSFKLPSPFITTSEVEPFVQLRKCSIPHKPSWDERLDFPRD